MLMTIAAILAVFWVLGPRGSGPSGTGGSPNRYLRSGSRTIELPGASGMKLWRAIPFFK